LLTEAIMLFVLGGPLGVTMNACPLRLLVRLAPPTLSWLHDVSLDGPMLAVALGTAGLTGVIFAVLPSGRVPERTSLKWSAAGLRVRLAARCHIVSGGSLSSPRLL
jgi:hypothetical protein